MANIMSLKSVKNKTQRNGFDLSTKRNFTAKVGELLPVWTREVIPGDSFDIDLKSLLRTQPINTAAFARLRYYFDFYFVPYEVLWRFSDTVLTQMYDNAHHSTSSDPASNTPLVSQIPFTTCSTIANYLNKVAQSAQPGAYKSNCVGFNRGLTSAKLLEYLGYGDFYRFAHNASGETKPPTWSEKAGIVNLNVNLFPLLAYQKIYNDFYKDAQWERLNPTCFNVDWMLGTTAPAFTSDHLTDNFVNYSNMFDLRYCNWQKDLFHGVLPSQQYGSESIARSYLHDIASGKFHGASQDATILFNNSAYSDTRNNVKEIRIFKDSLSPDLDKNYSELSIIALRQAEALQKYKEVALATNKNYKDQIESHWGVKVTGDYGDTAQYLGGIDASIDINEVVNSNITADNAADIAGKGIGTNSGKVSFNSNGQYGVIMCIFHALPLLDYTTNGVDMFNTRINATDFAIPELDSVGMQGLNAVVLSNSPSAATPPLSSAWTSGQLGFVPRYIDYKTDYDRSYGAFKTTLENWIIKYGDQEVRRIYQPQQPGFTPSPVPDSVLNYTFFKVRPSSVDSLFGVAANNYVDTDQLLVSTFFDVKAVRNLDVNGLPY